jgi:hypothetical protein
MNEVYHVLKDRATVRETFLKTFVLRTERTYMKQEKWYQIVILRCVEGETNDI